MFSNFPFVLINKIEDYQFTIKITYSLDPKVSRKYYLFKILKVYHFCEKIKNFKNCNY